MDEANDTQLYVLEDAARRYDVLLEELPEPVEANYPGRLDDFWAGKDDAGRSRKKRIIQLIEAATRAELNQKVEVGLLLRAHKTLFEAFLDRTEEEVEPCAYQVEMATFSQAPMPLAGAFLLTERKMPESEEVDADVGVVLLYLPGIGLEGYRSLQEATEGLDQRMTRSLDREAMRALLSAQPTLSEDDDSWSWSFTPVAGPLFEACTNARIDKLRSDVGLVLEGGNIDQSLLLDRINQVTRRWCQQGLTGVVAHYRPLLEEREVRRNLPQWYKQASEAQRIDYAENVHAYDLTVMDLQANMGGGYSARHSAHRFLREQLDRKLGRSIDPALLTVTTRRHEPVANEHYTVTCDVFDLIWNGLHPGDEAPGSDFSRSTLHYRGEPVTETLIPGLTPLLLAEVIAPWQMRARYPLQYVWSLNDKVRGAMGSVIDARLRLMALTAHFQGQMSDAEHDRVQRLRLPLGAQGTDRASLLVLAGEKLASVLVVTLQGESELPEAFLLHTPQAPGRPDWQRFASLARLRQELLAWSAEPVLRRYLLERVPADGRVALEQRLARIAERPALLDSDLLLEEQSSYSVALEQLVSLQIALDRAEHSRLSPAWYGAADARERRQLNALEDRIKGLRALYESQAHTRLQSFTDFVHEQASIKLNRLLGAPDGVVDPDNVIITSPRETLSFTRLMRDGYDDSIGFLNPTLADQATLAGPEGIDLRPLTAEKVAGAVRGQWLGDRYCALVRDTLINPASGGYRYRQEVSLEITRLQMRHGALCSKLKGELSDEQYRWLSASLDNFEWMDRTIRERYPVFALSFLLSSRREQVDGVYIFFDPDSLNDRSRALLYTPDAPDGLTWRSYESVVEILNTPGMGDYFLNRMPRALGRSIARRFEVMRDLGIEDGPGPGPVLQNLFEAFFDTRIEARLRDVEDSTVGRGEMLAGLVWTSVEIIATALTLPFPVASFVVGMALWAKDAGQALSSLARGEHEAASGYMFAAMLNGLGAAGDLSGGVKGIGWLLRAAAKPEARKVIGVIDGLAGQAESVPRALQLEIDPQHALKRQPAGALVYRIEGRYAGLYEGTPDASGYPFWYIKDEVGYWYRVKVDSDGLVRLLQRNPSGYGMPLEHLGSGRWQVWKRYGLLGGGRDDAIDLFRQAVRQMSPAEANALGAQLNLPGSSNPGHFHRYFQSVTRSDIETLLQGFDWMTGLGWDVELAMARSVAMNRRLPAWALQFRQGAPRDSVQAMLARANEAFPDSAPAVRLEDFSFPQMYRESMEFNLALHLEVMGRIPPGALDFRLPEAARLHPLLGAAFAARSQPQDGWRLWSVELNDGGHFERAVVAQVGGRYYPTLPDNGAPSIIGANYPDYAIIFDPNVSHAQFVEALQGHDLSPLLRQMHLLESREGSWEHFGPLFVEPLPRIIGEMFPLLDPRSQTDLAGWMLREADRSTTELTSTRLLASFEALSAWRGRGGRIPRTVMSDPLALLPRSSPLQPGHGRRYPMFGLGRGRAPMLGFVQSPGPGSPIARVLQESGYVPVLLEAHRGMGAEQLVFSHPRSDNYYLVIRSSTSTSAREVSIPNPGAGREFLDDYLDRLAEPLRSRLVQARADDRLLVFGAGVRTGGDIGIIRFDID
ncbi:dermonecrotic toxin domain-containing protein [Pseudomonas akapageensis]|uniref:dermonecrotic toxin domain-containing protein n=1 Tax=Pseudomonas akapageensis TaxID=2609961 RepID=UPI0014094A94|nr:DUF6543 domain-containing protein [Pseudomonas akapageensis]